MPLTNFTSVSTLSDILILANTNSGGYFWTSMVFLIFFIMLVTLLNFGFTFVVLTSAFVGMLLALFLSYIGLVGWGIVGIFVDMIVFTIFYIVYSSPKYG